LMYEKTGGNPFFAIQFFTALTEEGLLVFDLITRTWQWDINHIRAKSFTENVVDLMAGKLKRLSAATQEALKQLACLGNVAEIATLALVQGVSEDKNHADLEEAVRAGLIFRSSSSYSFLHDRVQEATYALISDSERAAAHLRIGRLLESNLAPRTLLERIFEIVNHFNRAAKLITSRDESYRVAELNLVAGRRAKAAAAYSSALAYFASGSNLLPDDRWQQQHGLAFALELNRTECEFLCGNLEASELLLEELLKHCASKDDKSAACRLKIELEMFKSAWPQAIQTACECLQLFNVRIAPFPTREEIEAAFADVWRKLDGRPIKSLIALPRANNRDVDAAMGLLEAVHVAALVTNEALLQLVLCKMIDLTLDHGITGASPHGLAWFGVQVGHLFGRYAEGYEFASLANELVERHGLFEHKGRVLLSLEVVSLWTCPITMALDTARAALAAAAATGALSQACFACHHIVTDLLLRGDHLDETMRETDRGLAFVRRAKHRTAVDTLLAQQSFIENMRGNTSSFSSFDGEDFKSSSFEAQLTSHRSQTIIFWYWVLKGQARYISGDFEEAAGAFANAKPLRWASSGHIQLVNYHLFSALTLALLDKNNSADGIAHRLELKAHCEQLRRWAENYPNTFADKHALVAAEIARIEGRELDAERLYEEAIRSARENGFVQNEGLALEVAARFYKARGFETFANAYLRNARYCYVHWGAHGKVRQLDRLYPQLTAPDGHRPTAITDSAVWKLDVASVVKASQALSSEIVLSKLIERLMTIALENAGADRGLLILAAEDDNFIQAEAKATGDQVEVALGQKLITGTTCPESIVRYVIRTQERVILDDASRPNSFSEDDYLRGRQAKSILCIPLSKQGRLTGLLYLENTLTSHAFAPDRIAILELLAAQAAISLENTRLYSDLQERETRVRRLVESNVIGIFIWDFEGRILEANDAFLHMLRYGRDDLAAGRIRWTDLTPPEWHDLDARLVEENKMTGRLPPFEKEYFRKDGCRVPVLIGVATFEEGGDQGVAFVLDLTERKKAEAEARESERRYREAQAELAHVTRVTTLGELTVSIAHEVNQPLAALLANAEACQLWLDRAPPNLDGARRSVEWIIKDGNRAANVIRRVRELLKKSDTRMAPLDVNDAVNDSIALVQRELLTYQVSLRMELAPALPVVLADRVQLQQVIINLVINGIEAMQSVTDRPRELTIRTRQDEAGLVLVTLNDSGVGISAADPDQLFNAFFTTKSSGMGMGLSICRSIIEAHGGRVWAEPNLPRGAIFHFTLPLHREEAL
jgi:PAS domain S-box-containing protein